MLTGLSVSAVGASSVKLFNLGITDDTQHVKPRLLSQLCDDDTIWLLGRSYVELMPAERSREQLMKEVYGRSVNVATLPRKDILLMQTGLEKSIKRDFEIGETVILRGWVLSLTEARQCALFFLLNS